MSNEELHHRVENLLENIKRENAEHLARLAVRAYRLPEGLPDGAECVLVGMDTGIRDVEYQGQRFTVPMACVDSGWERIGPKAR